MAGLPRICLVEVEEGMKEHGERIAVLETHTTTVLQELETLNKQVGDINSKLDKSIGFLGGAAFVFSLLGAALGMSASFLIKKLGS